MTAYYIHIELVDVVDVVKKVDVVDQPVQLDQLASYR